MIGNALPGLWQTCLHIRHCDPVISDAGLQDDAQIASAKQLDDKFLSATGIEKY